MIPRILFAAIGLLILGSRPETRSARPPVAPEVVQAEVAPAMKPARVEAIRCEPSPAR